MRDYVSATVQLWKAAGDGDTAEVVRLIAAGAQVGNMRPRTGIDMPAFWSSEADIQGLVTNVLLVIIDMLGLAKRVVVTRELAFFALRPDLWVVCGFALPVTSLMARAQAERHTAAIDAVAVRALPRRDFAASRLGVPAQDGLPVEGLSELAAELDVPMRNAAVGRAPKQSRFDRD
jgi:hypothetical protein